MSGPLLRIGAWIVAGWLSTLCSCTAALAATPPAPEGGIAAEETWRLNGSDEALLVRGDSLSNPVLVLLHGGPGVSETALFRAYVPELERSFTVLYWDQPGAGRSYTSQVLERPLTMQRILDDLDALVDHARSRFHADKVVLLGHSFGSALGILYARDHPQKVAVYVGTGQVASMPEGEMLSYRFAMEEAQKRGDARAISALRAAGPPPQDVDAMLESRKWVERFGGTFGNGMSTGGLIWAALRTPEATLLDLYRFGAGNRVSLEAIWPAFSRIDLTREAPRLAVPVFMLVGREDHVTPASLAAAYFDALDAPCKRIAWFDHAAHNVPFEAPRAFLQVMEGPVLSAARSGKCS